MRHIMFAALLALASCATVPGNLPTPRYAEAASRGALSAFFAGRPNQAQVDEATNRWTDALSDSFGCGVPTRDVLNAGLVGALEIGAMNAAASGGGQREVREGVGRYVAQMAAMAVAQHQRPAASRCSALAAWAPRTAQAGREAVQRARQNGLMDNDYGLLMDLITR